MAGDELIVPESAQLGRNTADVVLRIDELNRRGVVRRMIGMPSPDTTSDDGRLIGDIVASLAANERRRTWMRQAEGIAVAKVGGQQIAEVGAHVTADQSLRVVGLACDVDVKTLRAYPPAPTLAQGGGNGIH